MDLSETFRGNGSVNTFLLLGSNFLIMQQLDYNNVISKGQSQLRMSSVREAIKREHGPEAEE
jgi:hypothetical protein